MELGRDQCGSGVRKKVKVFCEARSNHRGSKAASSGSGKQITAVTVLSAAGKVALPFFLVQGKHT